MKKEANREATIGFPEDYAEELSPYLLPGRRSETGAGWLGDAGEYCGDTGEDCDADALLNCEYGGDTGINFLRSRKEISDQKNIFRKVREQL